MIETAVASESREPFWSRHYLTIGAFTLAFQAFANTIAANSFGEWLNLMTLAGFWACLWPAYWLFAFGGAVVLLAIG